jgi:hypothetical protein
MSGSIPLPLDVTRSIGGAPGASGLAFFSAAIVAFRFVPPVDVGSYPFFPAADGRPWKYCGLVNG